MNASGSEPPSPLRGLSRRLLDIARRGRSHRWRGWTEGDAATLEAAAREMAAFEASLEKGMRDAFEIGRQYGKGEDVLDRLNREIVEATNRLARAAWSDGSHEKDRSEGPPERT